MSSSDDSRLGARIRRLRLERDLPQREVAEPLITTAYLSLIESGKRAPSENVLAHIARRLGIDTVELQTGRSAGYEAELELDLTQARSYAYRGDLTAADDKLVQVTKAARRFRLTRLQARAICVAASLEERRGDFAAARDLYDEAQGLLQVEPAHLRFEAVVGYARCTKHIENEGSRLAIHILESFLVELKHSGLNDPGARMRVLSSLVHLYRSVGYEQRSVAAAEEALSLGSQVDDPEQVACMSMNVARSLLEQGRHDDAVAALRSAEKVYQSLDWPLPEVRSKINRGIVEVDKGRLEAAKQTFTDALAILERHPDERSDLAAVLDQLGRVERLLGDASSATGLLTRARQVLPEDDLFERAMNARELGLTLASSKPTRAQRELRASADLYKAAGSSKEAGRSLLELGRILSDVGDSEKAVAVLTEGLELNGPTAT